MANAKNGPPTRLAWLLLLLALAPAALAQAALQVASTCPADDSGRTPLLELACPAGSVLTIHNAHIHHTTNRSTTADAKQLHAEAVRHCDMQARCSLDPCAALPAECTHTAPYVICPPAFPGWAFPQYPTA
jgi:hypothetical protein